MNKWWTKHEGLSSRLISRASKMDDSIQPLFTFGVIADIQYADIDDGYNFTHTRKRYYRNSLQLLRRANEKWKTETVQPSFILQLGDIIDGFNKKYEASQKALDTVLTEFDRTGIAVHHVWGNHEFYNFSRQDLITSLNSQNTDFAMREDEIKQKHPDNEQSYAYHFSPAPNFRFVVLDAYDVSLIGRQENSEQYNQALKILQEHNGNYDLNQPPAYSGLEQRFVKFNGGFGQDQLEWLDRLLSLSDQKLEKVTIVSHLPIHPSSTDPVCLAWNYDDVLSILYSHKSVVCFMAGHDHDGGYHQDISGIHHLTFEGVIETRPNNDAFGTVYVYEDRMKLKGNGRVPHRSLNYE
ncbi:manganese-dependent ADP-ribose/CDP-alcohol diphosphatase isoform X2 [Paramormyrops kingsleyae]|uniref:Manganese-dependent ADP-ribose/CDP-alcohol diphosphatase n=1 Tax=Paramormyrops kingsleyae TaxID=1676925 RepID=A0A3B3RGM6_9TELE|nr:manganese-dependent ADP-ribose/CDP-alcohol diphosphatase isoform X2 [Paramormyrops kingsleyae]